MTQQFPDRWLGPTATSWPEPVAAWGGAPQSQPTTEVQVPWLSPGAPSWAGRMAEPSKPSSSSAVWALALGVIGLLAGWCLLGAPCIAAVIVGHIALNDTKDDRKTGRGMAVTGLVLGYVALIPAMILFFWMIVGGFGATVTPAPAPTPIY